METSSGMMAVVKGTHDAGLSVAIVDGDKTYGLQPNTFTKASPNQPPKTTPYVNFLPPVYNPYECHRMAKVPHFEEVHNMTNPNPHMNPMNNIPHMNNMAHMNNMSHMAHMANMSNMGTPMQMPGPQAEVPCGPKESRSISTNAGLDGLYASMQSCDTGCQVVDGRYASVYQTTLCHQKPTSPPVTVTEFPPQRPGPLEKGGQVFQSNFVVGGPGSGDTGYSPPRYNNTFRGGMTWTERGSVCSPRVSRASNSDPFTSSLRKYPRVSPDRSSEIVERLITYTQAKNYGKVPYRQNSSRNSEQMGRRYMTTKSNKYTDESPTRDVTKKMDGDNFRKSQLKNFDVRYVRDMSRIVRDNLKATSPSPPFQQPIYPLKSREFHASPGDRSRPSGTNTGDIRCPNMVSSEIQAAAKMVCKEVSTCPRISAPKRIVSLPKASRPPSTGAVSYSIQGTPQNLRLSSPIFVQSSKSSTQVQRHNEPWDTQRSLSEASIVPLKKDVRKQEIVDEKFVAEELKNWRRKHDKNRNAIENEDTRKLTDIALRNKHSEINAFYATLSSCTACNDNIAIRRVIRNWLYDVPLKQFDYFGRLVRKEQILSYIICRLKIIPTEVQSDIKKFRAEVLDIVDGVPFQTENCNRLHYLSKLTEDLLNRLLHVKIKNATECRHIKPKSMKYYNRNTFIVNHVHTIPNSSINPLINTVRNNIKAYRVATTETTPGPALLTAKPMNNIKTRDFGTIRPSGNEIQEFIRAELTNSVKKSELNIDMSKVLEIETDVVYILFDNLDNIYKGKDDDTLNEITWLLRETGGLLRQQAATYAENLLEKFKDRFFRTLKYPAVDRLCATSYIQVAEKQCDAVIAKNNIVVNRSLTQSVSTSTESRHGNKDNVKKEEINVYKRQLEQVIEQWLNNFSNVIPQICNKQFRQAVIIDLIEDIIYRKRYLELSPRIKVAEKTELEHLRYQIFKWVNKLVGHNSMVTLVKVPELMKAIQSIDVSNTDGSLINHIPNPRSDIQSNQITPKKAETKTPNPNLTRPVSAINLSKNIPIYISQTSSVVDHSKLGSILESDHKNDSINSNSPANSSHESESKKSEGVGSAVVPGTTTVSDTTSLEGEVDAATSINEADLPPPAPTEQEMLVNQECDKLRDYIREWVETVPIIDESVSEEIIKKARHGLFVGVSDIVQRVMQLPRVYHDEFFLQDFFDDHLEDLLDAVPPVPEFLEQKHALKLKLIEKVVFHFKEMKFTEPRQRYIEKLAKNLCKYVPKLETQLPNTDPELISEQTKILYIVEDYILTLAHREEDMLKYNAYRLRLIQHLREFVEELKKKHKTEYLSNIHPDIYMTEIIKSLEQVPKPSDETIKEQADEILLKIEVDRWFQNLPIAFNNDMQEQYKRMRLRDELSKKLFEWDRKNLKSHSGSVDESAQERELKHQVSRVLGKLPLLKDESLKITDMIDDLTNKVKNRLRYEKIRNENISVKMQARRPKRAAAPQYRPQMHQLNDSQSQYSPYYIPGALPQRPGLVSRTDSSMPRRSGLPGRRVVFQQPPMPTIPQRNVALDESIPLGYILDRYEAYHPPYATPNASIQFGPTRSNLIQNPEIFGRDLPFSSTMNEQRFQRSLNLGNLSGPPCLQNVCEQFNSLPSMEQQGVSESCTGERCTPRQEVNQIANLESSSEWKSMESTAHKPEIWNRTPIQPISSPSADPSHKDPSTISSFGSEKSPLPTRDTIWIQPYLDEYEAAHPNPPTDPSGPLTYGFQPAENNVLYPPNYAIFSAERPLSSSAYHLDSMLDDSISIYQPYYAIPGIGLTEPSRYYAMNRADSGMGQGLVPGQIHSMSGPYGLRQTRDPRSQTHIGIGQGMVPGPSQDFNLPHGMIRYVSDPMNPGQFRMYQRLVPAPTHEMIGPSGMMQPPLLNNVQMGTSQRFYPGPPPEVSGSYGIRNVSGLVSQAPMEMSQQLYTSHGQNLSRPSDKSHSSVADSVGAAQSQSPAHTRAGQLKSGLCGLEKCQIAFAGTSETSPEERFRKLWEEKAASAEEIYQTKASDSTPDESRPRVEEASSVKVLVSLAEKGSERTKGPKEDTSSPKNLHSGHHQSSPGRVFGFPGELIIETGNVSRSIGPGIGAHPSLVREPPTNLGDHPQQATYRDQGVQYIPHGVEQGQAGGSQVLFVSDNQLKSPEDVPYERSSYHTAAGEIPEKISRENYKCVQTTISMIHFGNEKKRYEDLRKTKSHNSLKVLSFPINDDVFDWLLEVYNRRKSKTFHKKFRRIAENLNKPGGEDRLREKINEYLKKRPSHFSVGDEDGQRFRQQLPDFIIKKIRNVYSQNQEAFTKQSCLANSKNLQTNLRSVLKRWIKNIPFESVDAFDKPVIKKTILNSVYDRLLAFILERAKYKQDYKCMLLSYVTTIVNELPIVEEVKCGKDYITAISEGLTCSLLKIEKRKRSKDKSKVLKSNDVSINSQSKVKKTLGNRNENLKDKSITFPDLSTGAVQNSSLMADIVHFVTNEIYDYLEGKNVITNENCLSYLITEISKLLLDVISCPKTYKDDDVKLDVSIALQEIGELPKCNADQISEKIVTNFKDLFVVVPRKSKKKSGNGADAYLICYYDARSTPRMTWKKKMETNAEIDLPTYAKLVAIEIQQWIYDLNLPNPKRLKSAVYQLTQSIVDRHSYVESNQVENKSAFISESDYLHYLIFKWARLIGGEENMRIMLGLPDLVARIQKVNTAKIIKAENYKKNPCIFPQMSVTEECSANFDIINDLYAEIYEWYYDLPEDVYNFNDKNTLKNFIKNIAESIAKDLMDGENLSKVIDRQINFWSSTLLKRPERMLLNILKQKLRSSSIICGKSHKANVASQIGVETNTIGTEQSTVIKISPANIQRAKQQIEQWLHSLPLKIKDVLKVNTAINDFAADIVDTYKYLEKNPHCKGTYNDELETIKYQIYKWLSQIFGEDALEVVRYAPLLLNRLKCLLDSRSSINCLSHQQQYGIDSKDCGLQLDAITYNDPTLNNKNETINKEEDLNKGIPTKEPLSDESLKNETLLKTSNNETSITSIPVVNPSELDYTQGLPQSSLVSTTSNLINNVYGQRSSSTKVSSVFLTLCHNTETQTSSLNSCYNRAATKGLLDEIPTGMNLTQTYRYFEEIIRHRCQELPISSTVEVNGELPREAMFSGIWKTFFKLKADSVVESDDAMFKDMFKNRLDLMLDCLPQTQELKDVRQQWNQQVVLDAIKLNKYIKTNNIKTPQCCSQSVYRKLQTYFSVNFNDEGWTEEKKLAFILDTTSDFTLHTKYINEDPDKAQTFKERLVKRLEEFANIKNKNAEELKKEIFNILETVPAPEEKVLKEQCNKSTLDEKINQENKATLDEEINQELSENFENAEDSIKANNQDNEVNTETSIQESRIHEETQCGDAKLVSKISHAEPIVRYADNNTMCGEELCGNKNVDTGVATQMDGYLLNNNLETKVPVQRNYIYDPNLLYFPQNYMNCPQQFYRPICSFESQLPLPSVPFQLPLGHERPYPGSPYPMPNYQDISYAKPRPVSSPTALNFHGNTAIYNTPHFSGHYRLPNNPYTRVMDDLYEK